MKEYQLRDMETGLFDTGKMTWRPKEIVWGKRGKRWKRLSDLNAHLTYVEGPIKSTWEVIEYELVESSRFSVATLIDDRRRLAGL